MNNGYKEAAEAIKRAEEAINSIIAECILETEILNDAYVIADADTFFEAKEKIKKIIGND